MMVERNEKLPLAAAALPEAPPKWTIIRLRRVAKLFFVDARPRFDSRPIEAAWIQSGTPTGLRPASCLERRSPPVNHNPKSPKACCVLHLPSTFLEPVDLTVNRNQESAKIAKWLKFDCGRRGGILPRVRLLDVELERRGEEREGDGAEAVGVALGKSAWSEGRGEGKGDAHTAGVCRF